MATTKTTAITLTNEQIGFLMEDCVLDDANIRKLKELVSSDTGENKYTITITYPTPKPVVVAKEEKMPYPKTRPAVWDIKGEVVEDNRPVYDWLKINEEESKKFVAENAKVGQLVRYEKRCGYRSSDECDMCEIVKATKSSVWLRKVKEAIIATDSDGYNSSTYVRPTGEYDVYHRYDGSGKTDDEIMVRISSLNAYNFVDDAKKVYSKTIPYQRNNRFDY
jgi:hypothetical protein